MYASRDGEIREALAERGIDFAPLREFSLSEVRRVIREVRPDLIHAHDMHSSFLAALACGDIPLISHIHNNSFDSRRISLKSVLYRYAARRAKHIFWVSRSAYEGYRYHAKYARKSSVLVNTVDPVALRERAAEDSTEYCYDAIFLGRLTYPKHPERLLSVFRRVVELVPTASLAVVGTGELYDDVRALASELGLDENVTFLGFSKNPYKVLASAKVMMMTSRWEGMPMCALEAMAFGVPIVSTPVDGLKDVVVNGENGYLSSEDEALASEIARIITDPAHRAVLGEGALRCFEEKFDKDRYRDVVLEAYRAAVSKK